VIGSTEVRAASTGYGPWSFLTHDDYRTPISFGAPVELQHHCELHPTEMHANYFRVQPVTHRLANAQDYLRYIVTAVFRSASNATPVDTEFWAQVFPSIPGRPATCVVRLTYVTAPRSRFEMELADVIIPDEAPALELVFSARHAFVPASLPGQRQQVMPALPQRSRATEAEQIGAAIPLGTVVPQVALPLPKRDLAHVAAFQRLRDALPITDDELALVVGVGRTTPYKWNREGSSPQPKTLRLILWLDAIVRGLLASRDRAQFDQWLLVGDPAPIQLLHDHAIEAFERRAHAAVFTPVSQSSLGYDLEAPSLPQRTVAPPSIAPRRAKVSLAKRDR
jgi:hypothetical protein